MKSLPPNRIYRGDCKLILKDLIQEGIKADLIYLDPPFNSNRVYNMIFNGGGLSAQQKAFHDMWNFTERARQLTFEFTKTIDQLNDIPTSFKEFIKAWVKILEAGSTEDRKLLNYLMYMTERLVLMKRFLAPRGTIMLHCDPTASHYIKVIMDGIFGNFINEIIWYYPNASRGKKMLAKSHDVILWYSNDKIFNFNRDDILVPYESGMTEWRYTKGGQAGKDMPKGKTPDDIIKIPSINPMSKERRGYETQKPQELLEFLVKMACPNNGLVVDPFCGCGTTIAAAIVLKRNWIGVDISGDAVNEICDRIGEMKDIHLRDNCKFNVIESNPETKREYNRLNPFEKQDWLIRKINGFPNPRKSGDSGVDGEKTIHLGGDQWGKMIFSVKTGKQSSPVLIRELRGTMAQEKAEMGGLILDVEPSKEMEEKARAAGILNYKLKTSSGIAEQSFERIQILTSQEIIDGKYFIHPPTLAQKKQEQRHSGNLL